jgi:hypothetical protein
MAEVIVGIEFDFLVELGDSQREIDLAHAEDVGRAEKIVRAGSFGILGDGFFEFGNGQLGVAVFAVGAAKIHTQRRGIAEGGKHLGENFRGAFFFLEREIGGGQGVSVFEIGFEGDGRFELAAGGFEIVHFKKRAAEDAAGLGVFRFGINHGLSERLRFRQVFRGESGFGVFELDGGVVRNECERSVKVLSGFGEVAGF